MAVSRLVGERGVSQWRLDAGVLQPVSLTRAFSCLGTVGERRRRTIRSKTGAAERASRWLWLKEEIHGVMVASQPSGQRLRSDQPQLGHLEEGV